MGSRHYCSFDFDVHTCGQVEFHQGIHSLVGGIHDVHQTLVRAVRSWSRLVLLTCGERRMSKRFMRVGRARGLDDGAGAFGGVHDLGSGLVDQFVIKRL